MNYKPPYSLTDSIIFLVEQIGEALDRASMQGKQELRLRRVNRIRTIHGSVAIEGNTLSEKQITAILEGKRVVAPPREVLEVRNALAAYSQLSNWVPENEAHLLKAHSLLMAGLLDGVGRYRSQNAGVMGPAGVIHVAPPAERVSCLMKQLLGWLESAKQHPLVAAAVFHYEFEFIHPFADGNGRTGRLWQTLILSRWNPLFADLPVESIVHLHQQEYYAAINRSSAGNDCAPFIEFILKMILETLDTEQVSDQVSDQVGRLLAVMQEGSTAALELMKKLALLHRPTFRKNYLQPALFAGLIEMTRPDAPRAKNQKYRLTAKGRSKLRG